MLAAMKQDSSEHFNRMPKVTVGFWLVKLMAVTMGETAADYLAVNLGHSLGTTASATRFLTMGAAPPDNQHRRTLSSAGTAPAENGISYTVQVLPEGASAWQTIAVGRQTPAVEFDRNQFPGSRTAQVRILRSTGFEDEVFAQEEINLSD